MAESGNIRIKEALLAGDNPASFWDEAVGNRMQDIAAFRTKNHNIESFFAQDADKTKQRLLQCIRLHSGG